MLEINLQLLLLNGIQIQAENVRWRLVFDLVRAGDIRASGQHEGRRQRRGSKCSRSSQLLDAKVSTAGNVWVFFFFYRQLQNGLIIYSFFKVVKFRVEYSSLKSEKFNSLSEKQIFATF